MNRNTEVPDALKKGYGYLLEVLIGLFFLSVLGFGSSDWVYTAYAELRAQKLYPYSGDMQLIEGTWPTANYGIPYAVALFLIWRFLLRGRFPRSGLERMGWGTLAGVLSSLVHGHDGGFFWLKMACLGALHALWIFKAEEALSSFEF